MGRTVKDVSKLYTLFLLALVACGGSKGLQDGSSTEISLGSCALQNSGSKICIEYTGGMDTNSAKNLCSITSRMGNLGVYDSSACPASIAGTCVMFANSAGEQSFKYLDGWTTSTAQLDCTSMHGTYVSN